MNSGDRDGTNHDKTEEKRIEARILFEGQQLQS